ncbi:MAG: sulfite oxidase, partial [Methyloligellaceae bacterium]
ITPTKHHFIRNNGIAPESFGAKGWKLTIDGLVDKPMTFTIDELKKKFEVVTATLQIECGGNGRAFFDPPARGNQWTYGAVACSEWTGVRFADVLKAAGVKDKVIYTAHVGADTHLSGKEGKLPISRGLPIKKAMEPQNLIAFGQNGTDIHPMNGAPLRLVIPGWPGSFSQKWLTRIWLRDVVHDGPKMTGAAYRVPPRPVAPGTKVDSKTMVFIQSMPVKSLITNPATGYKSSNKKIEVRGHAWAGDREVDDVHVSIDFGATWKEAKLDDPVNPYAWQNWSADVEFSETGYYEVWARAKDSEDVSQPHAIAWNPKGYVNNAMHRVAVTIS